MDDQKFDDIIKGKVGDYEEPGFDPAALAAWHHQMAAATVTPWYAQYRSELLTGSMVFLCTALILFSQWYWRDKSNALLEADISALQAEHRQQLGALQKELEARKGLHQDTIYISETSTLHIQEFAALHDRIAALELEIQKLIQQNNTRAEKADSISPSEFPERSQNSSTDHGADQTHPGFSPRVLPGEKKSATVRAKPDSLQPLTPYTTKLSSKTIRDLEQHYHQGIGIKLGPAVSLSQGFYNVGSGQTNLGYGLLADFILSPSLSLETGVSYASRYFEISNPNELAMTDLPDVDETVGELLKAETDYWMLELPLNLKYRYPISLKTHWLAGVGYSQIIYLKEVIEYSYYFDDGTGSNNFIVNSEHDYHKTKLYPGALNFSLGVSHRLKNKKLLETSISYQHGLGETGVEKVKPKFFNVRGVYWFTVK